ncbi:hypothetical protein GCM10022237_39580 [Nocardioides ginsengisoli]
MTSKGQRFGEAAASLSPLLAVGRRVLFAAPFVVVVMAPAVASWTGLVRLGREWLDLGAMAPLVPLTIDAAGLYMALLAWRATLAGDSAGLDRFLVWLYAGLSAALNVWHADAVGGMRAAVFYGIASLSAAMVWERTLRAMRRQELRELGAIDSPAPRYRPLRWMLHYRETWGAFSLAVGQGISNGDLALATYREAQSLVTSAPRDKASEAELQALIEKAGDLDPALVGLTKKAALLLAFQEVGEVNVPAARYWLAERGLKTDRSNAHKVANEHTAALASAPHLKAIAGGGQA